MNNFGEKLKTLREANSLLQKEVATKLNIDCPMLSKIESGERKAKKNHVELLAELYQTDQKYLVDYWLADQLIKIVESENVGLNALSIAERILKTRILNTL